MSRYPDYAASADPLQRRPATAIARTERSGPSHSLHAGLVAIAPRLALVFLVASAIQMLTHWVGR